MPNQHTPPDQRKPKRRGKLVSLTEDERATLVAGAAALGETPTATLRIGGLQRAAHVHLQTSARACVLPRFQGVTLMPNQHTKPNPAPRRCRQVRFTDAEWLELQQGAQAIGETRSEAIRAGAMSRVRQSIPDASDVTPSVPDGACPIADKPSSWEINGDQFDADKWRTEQTAIVSVPIPDDWTKVQVATPHIFACAYCIAEFCTSFDAEEHIDAMHGGQP